MNGQNGQNGQNPSTRAFTDNRSPATAAVDSVLRRALKVSDPRNAEEVAKALLARYADEAATIKREQQGLPFSVVQAQAPVTPQLNGASRPEVRTASNALDAALTVLTTSPDLADIAPEMRGWRTTIERAAADGLASSAFAIDPAERDRAFGARRILGDYARLARYAGAITLCATEVYCRVAQACDDVANLILVMIGDTLGDAGLSRTGGVIQVPGATLQTRRDAVIAALRNILEPAPSDDQESWPRGARALSQIYEGLDAAGAADLRALLDEPYLSRQLDDLVDLATGSTSEGLRALGSAAAVTVQRLQRFLMIAQDLPDPPSPPASMFFVELRLFIQGFSAGSAGYRLPYLARSPLLVSAFAQSQAIDESTQALLNVAINRSAFADAIDCLCCCCDLTNIEALIVAGKVLFDIDRAIDLYALGTRPPAPVPGTSPAAVPGTSRAARAIGLSATGWRAAAYAAVIHAADICLTKLKPSGIPSIGTQNLKDIVTALQWPAIIGAAKTEDRERWASQLAQVIDLQLNDEARWSDLVSSIAPLCRWELLFDSGKRDGTDPIRRVIDTAKKDIAEQTRDWGITFDPVGAGPAELNVPAPSATVLEHIRGPAV